MNAIAIDDASYSDEQTLRDKFLADHRLFLGPDPEIMRNHSVGPRTAEEDAIPPCPKRSTW
jgi:acetone carboxylase alpha subunit